MMKEDKFESLKMEIVESNTDPIIKVDNTDDLDEENTCGMQMEEMNVKPTFKKILNKKICYKCKKNKSNYLNRTEFICRECFMKILNHKFRSNLRAHCKIRHEDYVLVCVSGGNNSMAMLHWFYTTFNDNTSNRKLFFKLKVVYIDDSLLTLVNNGNSESMEELRRVKKEYIYDLCKKYGFEVDIVNLEEVMAIGPLNCDNSTISTHSNCNSNLCSESSSNSPEDLINKYLYFYKLISKVGSFDEDFNKIMTRNLIFHYAIKNGFTKVVFGNSAQALVSNIFSTIVKGRGFTVREDIGYIDDHYLNGKITILRPMKDFLAKEVLLFNYIHNVQIIYPESLNGIRMESKSSHTPFDGSTSLLVNRFFDRLQERMSSTVTTVLGTAEKLKFKDKSNKLNFKNCSFCLNYIDEVYNELEIGSIDAISNDKIFGNKSFCFGCKRMLQSAVSENEEILHKLPIFFQ